MPIQVTPLTEKGIPGAVKCIQDAFAEDPYNHWVFNDRGKFSPTRNTASLSIRCRWGMHYGIFNVAKDTTADDPDKVLGVGCWLRPRGHAQPPTWTDYWGDWWLWFEQVKMNLWHGRGGLNVKRYYIWKDAQAAAERELLTDARGYYFCNLVAVAPESQGRGVGRLLFEDVLARADEEGRGCYLESSRAEPNLAIYERFGFRRVKEMVCDDDGDAIRLYCMIREATQRTAK